MKTLSVYIIGKRGPCICTRLDGPEPLVGSHIRRRSDQRTWTIRGIEWFAINRRPTVGDLVGLLLPEDADPREGDEFDRV